MNEINIIIIIIIINAKAFSKIMTNVPKPKTFYPLSAYHACHGGK